MPTMDEIEEFLETKALAPPPTAINEVDIKIRRYLKYGRVYKEYIHKPTGKVLAVVS